MTEKEEFESLIQKVKESESNVKIFIERVFPVNSEIEYVKNNTKQKGKVLFHCYGFDLRVQNIKTNAIYNVPVYDIFRDVIK